MAAANINQHGLHGLEVTMHAQQGKGHILAELMVLASKRVKQLTGCRLYLVQQSSENTDLIFVSEVWDNQESHQVSLTDERIGEIISQARPLIVNMEFTPTIPVSE